MNGEPQAGPNIRLLKTIVIVLGVLIVAALAVVVGTIAVRLGGPGTPLAGPGFGERTLALPEGARLVGIAAAGDRLALHVELPDGSARLVMVDARTGERLGSLDLVPGR
jgi:hypothetical protein